MLLTIQSAVSPVIWPDCVRKRVFVLIFAGHFDYHDYHHFELSWEEIDG